MNTRKNIVFGSFSWKSVLLALVCGMAFPTLAQMQWSSYDTSGNLVTANVATGGDLASATSVTFTIPANTQLFFVTKNFTPINLATVNAAAVVTFKFSASAGLTGVAQRTVGWGLYNSAGTASLADDIGMYGDWYGPGAYIEGLFHASGSANLFSGTSPGLGKTATGTPTDGTTYTNQIRLFLKTAPNGVALGSSSSTLAAAGLAMNGANVTARSYTNPSTGTNTFDEFAFMFNNTTANPVTVTLSAIGLGNTMTWDASGANPTAPTDGSGSWSSVNANWSGGAGSAVGASDSVWSPGYSAVFGANNGAAGVITIADTAGEVVSNITFNAAGSGSYYITNSSLILTSNSTITVASGVSATNGALLGGIGFTKAGSGTFVLLPPAAATNVGMTTVNAGTLYLAGSSVNNLNDSVTVNSGATLLLNGSTPAGMNPASTLTINGGTVTNISLSGTATESHNLVVIDNGGILAYGPANSGQLNVTNFDFRNGLSMFPKMIMTTNFSVKSTPGTMTYIGRPSSTGPQGLILTLLGGTMLLNYPLVAPNNDTTQGGAKFQQSGTLTLGGGRLIGQFNSTASRTEKVANTVISPGATAFSLTNTTTGSYGFTMSALSRNVGGTINYRTGGAGSAPALTTTSANVNGILGGWATWEESDWAIGTSIGGYSAYTTSTDPTTWTPVNNVSLSGNPSVTIGDGTNINSLKLADNAALTLNGNFTLTSGGLLITGTAAPTITGGTLEGGSGADLIVQQYSSGNLSIASTLADNGTASSLTKSGPGTLIITGTDTMTGTNYLNGGTVSVNALTELAAGPLVMNNGTLSYTGSDVSSTRSVVLAGVGGTFDIEGSATVTQTTPVVSSGGANSTAVNGVILNLGDWGGLTKVGSGTLVLAANNVYNGPTVVSNGVLSVNGTNSLTGTSGLTNYSGGGSFIVYGGTLGGTGMISGPVDIKSGGTLSPGDSIGTLTLGAGLTVESGSTNLFEEQNGSSGDLIQVQGNLVIQPNATIAISVLGAALNPATNTLITYTGTKTGSFNPTVVVVGGSLNSSITIDDSTPGQVKLVAVPQVAITIQPTNTFASTNDPVTFTVVATGSSPLGYQWYYTTAVNIPSVAIPGANGSSYFIPSADGTNNGFYSVVVTNNFNSVTSVLASLTVGNVCSQLSGPFDQTVIQGLNATFSTIVVLGNPVPTLQWQTNGVDVTGATGTSLTLSNVQYTALNNAKISVIASNAACLDTNSVTLTIITTPVISPQPVPLTVNVGDTASFISGASAIPAPGLQWYKNGVGLPGQTGSTLTIVGAQGSDIGLYSLVATNTAGSVTSSVVKLTVNSTTLASTTIAPANGATGICYDTPLYLTFNGPISIANSGKIRIYNASNSVTPVDTIDMSSNTVIVSVLNAGVFLTNNVQAHSLFSGDSQVMNYFPVIISGTTAAIYPHLGVLTSNQTYYVTMDNGIVADSSQAYFAGISDTNAWRFTTKLAGPANPTNIVVAADGSGDFVTVQGAVDSVSPSNTTYTVVNIRNGTYTEIVDISGKNNITFRGQNRTNTIVGYQNNNNLTGTTAGRMAFKVNAADIKLENLTLTNTTPQGGSQAETLLIYNSAPRCIVNYCDISSRQDTILINAAGSQGYFNYCKIIGNFDYVWGVGQGYFYQCVFHTITNIYSGSYNLTAARTGTSGTLSFGTPWQDPNTTTLYSSNGFSFVSCKIEADSGVTGVTMAGSNGTAGGLDSWVNCLIDPNAYVTPTLALSNSYVFWQFNNTDTNGVNPVSFATIQTLTNNDPRLIAATNVTTWFYGWTPAMAPNIIGQPAGQTVTAGQTASFIVTATGIPNPTYQWYQNGLAITGATATNYNIASAVRTNGGSYTVVVSNGSGSVTSIVATLTYNNTAPVTSPATYSRPAGYPLNITIPGGLSTYWSDADSDPLALTGLISSTNGAAVNYDSNFVYYTNVNNVVDEIDYTVGDGFGGNTPGIITVLVGPPPTNSVAGAVVNGNGTATVSFVGVAGYTYQVDAATNLAPPVAWTTISTNTADINGLWQVTDLQATNYPDRFYRSAYRP